MSQSSEQSSFDKNLRSLLDAISMFEREASVVMDRFGLDTDAIGRVLDMLGAFSADAVRPLAAALGIADAAAVDALARDVRALLQSDARVRREQVAAAGRLEELVTAIEALAATTASLADLQARTQERLEALTDRTASMDGLHDQRQRLFDDVEALRKRIDDLENRLAADVEPMPEVSGQAAGGEDETGTPAVRPAARRQPPRSVKPAATGSHKILEGLPALEPKLRPA